MSKNITLAQAVSAFGGAVTAKLKGYGGTSAPEDQLRAPLEILFDNLAPLAGALDGVTLIGEATLSHLGTRPDYAVMRAGALVGFIEVKAPGKGANPNKFTDEHDKTQWRKLASLPNLLYCDGNSFGLWRNGERAGEIVDLEGDIKTAGARLKAPGQLVALISDFLSWQPNPPHSASELAQVCARLCRLLRDEVADALDLGNSGLQDLAKDWRELLFPEASDTEFADHYAQAVTFGLLVARARNVSLANGVDDAAMALRKTESLIGNALRLLTDNLDNQKLLATSLDTLTRVLSVVNWDLLTKGDADAWLYFYEDFLAVYDNKLRKRTGSYYTPPQVVAAMVRLVDEALRHPDLFNLSQGLADKSVTVADPAVGTGTFLLGVLRRIAETVEADKGPGAIPGAIEAAASRLIGFELQFGPFAVAQLRLLAEMQSLMGVGKASGHNIPSVQLFVTDTLADPYAAQTQFSSILAPIGESRRKANQVKKTVPITVVLGNPPYKEKAKGRGGWIEAGSDGREKPMDHWKLPPEWKADAHAKHLKNLYVYFWRWATWKVFGSGYNASTGETETNRGGIICFITVAGFLNGPGFQKMRQELRRDCSDIWVIDASPEGHQPAVASRIFEAVQQPVCIVLAARPESKDRATPAKIHFRSLEKGNREKKFDELGQITLLDHGWSEGISDWRDPLLAKGSGVWSTFPAVDSLFDYNGSGVMPGRTWVIAPDKITLSTRWETLINEKNLTKKEHLFHPHLINGAPGDKHIHKPLGISSQLKGYKGGTIAISKENGKSIYPARLGYRSFDRQWIIPDARVINRPNPRLWNNHSNKQIYLTLLHGQIPDSGPAISFSAHIPDLSHYHGRGGRVIPLWNDDKHTIDNIKPAVSIFLLNCYKSNIPAEDIFSYLACLLAHPGFMRAFRKEMARPGLRVPLTASADLFAEAVEIGREVVWLHCYGERFADSAAGRPSAAPRLPLEQMPIFTKGKGIPVAPAPLPDTMDYDPSTRTLRIGKGFIENVSPEIWNYEISGKNVLRQWFSCRRFDRSRPQIGDKRDRSPLDAIQPAHWLPEYTDDLIDLLHVLGRLVLLEPRQADLLDRICAGPLLTEEALRQAGAFEVASGDRNAISEDGVQGEMFETL